MLDPLPIGEPESKRALKCEQCGLEYADDENWESVDCTGHCVDCWASN